MKWYVVKVEWGLVVSDVDPFDDFDVAVQVCKDRCDLGVVAEPIFNRLQTLPQIEGRTLPMVEVGPGGRAGTAEIPSPPEGETGKTD